MELIRPRRSPIVRTNPALFPLADPFKWGEKIARLNKRGPKLWAGAGDRTYSFDANLALSDGAAAYTATGFAQYAGQQAFLDFGGNQNATIQLPAISAVSGGIITPQQQRIDATLVLDLTAITLDATDLYKVILIGSNNAGFTSGTVAMLAMMEFGIAGSLDTPNGFNTPAPVSPGGSRYELSFTNEQNNVKYEFVSLYNVISGTTPSITYRAFVAVLPEP